MQPKVIRNRIVEHRKMCARELMAHPSNFRRHPEQQKKVLRAMLGDVGFARSLLAYHDPEWGLTLIDGHLRQEELTDLEVDVEVLDVTREEANLILATLDPIAAMAEQADDIYRELMEGVETESEDLRAWCDGIIESLAATDDTCPFGDEMMPEALPPPEVSGDDNRTGRFILVWKDEAEKTLWMNLLKIDGKKVIYTVEALNG